MNIEYRMQINKNIYLIYNVKYTLLIMKYFYIIIN